MRHYSKRSVKGGSVLPSAGRIKLFYMRMGYHRVNKCGNIMGIIINALHSLAKWKLEIARALSVATPFSSRCLLKGIKDNSILNLPIIAILMKKKKNI